MLVIGWLAGGGFCGTDLPVLLTPCPAPILSLFLLTSAGLVALLYLRRVDFLYPLGDLGC